MPDKAASHFLKEDTHSIVTISGGKKIFNLQFYFKQ